MNVIDISSWQHGIDLEKVFAQNPLDGVVVKATQGTVYTNADFSGWVDWLIKNKKPAGAYHYLDGGSAEREAEHFYNVVRPYIGNVIPVADYEADALSRGTEWLRAFLERFRELSGVRPMIYCSLSVIQEQNFSALTEYPLWIAQYADMAVVNGFLDNPWQKGSVAPFSKYWMHQYTGNGRLNGYANALDLDKFYGTAEDWQALCKGSAPAPQPTPEPAKLKPADPSIVLRTLKNEFGIGQDRIVALRALGYDPDSVQKKINQLYVVGNNTKKAIGSEMSYLNSILWIVRS